MTARSTAEPTTFAARLRQRLRSFEPMYLALLGLLAVPSYVFDSLAALEVFELFFLFFLWPFVASLLQAVLRRGTDEDEAVEPTDWIHMGDWREYAAWTVMLPLTFLNPYALAQDVLQWLGGAVAFARHRGSLPDAAGYDQRVSYRLPVDGAWTVVNGSHDRDYSHSWFPPNQRYAYDFVITDADGRTRPEGAASRVDRYYCYDEPVLAPADGIVVDVCDDDLESSRAGGLSHPLKRDIRGNYVVVQHAPDEYSCLAHLVPGSAAVEPGDRVARGQQLGRCGHSGNSSEPHLHFQVQDHPDFEVAASLSVAFDDVAIEWPGAEAPITDPLLGADGAPNAADSPDADALDASERSLEDGTYRRRAHLSAGQRVAHVDRGAEDADRDAADGANDRGDAHTETPRSDARSETPHGDDLSIVGASSGHRTATAALQRVGFGACVGGVATVVASIFVSPLTVAALLVAVAAVGLIGWAARPFPPETGSESERRLGTVGIVAGVSLVAVVVAWYGLADSFASLGPQSLGGWIFLLGFVVYAAVGEYDRRLLRDSFRDAAGHRPT